MIIPRSIKPILSHLNYYRKLYQGPPIIVYQMGKVGSASIRVSLKDNNIKPVFHLHRMNPEYQSCSLGYPDPPTWLGIRLYSDIIRNRRPAKFITLIREPIGRNLSHFFFRFNFYTGLVYDDIDFSSPTASDLFLSAFGFPWRPLVWFDTELKETTGIDVYRYDFPVEQGYLSIREGNYDLLIIKLEIEDSIKEKAIAQFLGRDSFAIKRTNTAETNNYAGSYRTFLNKLALPKDYIELFYNSAYVNHFYSKHEINSFKHRWYSNSTEAKLPPELHHKLLQAATRDFNK